MAQACQRRGLAEDSLFLDSPSGNELQTIQKRKDPERSRDTQVENQALYDYIDGLTITMKVIQPRGRKEPKRQAAEVMQDVMLSSQGGQPSSVIHLHRKCYKCGQKGHYAKSCPQNQLSPVAPVQDPSPIPRTSGNETHLISENCSKQDARNDQAQQQEQYEEGKYNMNNLSSLNTISYCILILYAYKDFPRHFISFIYMPLGCILVSCARCRAITHLVLVN